MIFEIPCNTLYTNILNAITNSENSSMANCFQCTQKIGMFKKKVEAELITSCGYVPPQGMGKNDKLCQACIDIIKKSQVQGKILEQKQSVFWNIVLIFIIAPAPFIFLKRLTKWFLYCVLPVIVFTPILIIISESFVWSGAVLILTISVVLVVKWTNEWNENVNKSINEQATIISKSPITILKERYARGKVTKQEYDRIKEDLSD